MYFHINQKMQRLAVVLQMYLNGVIETDKLLSKENKMSSDWTWDENQLRTEQCETHAGKIFSHCSRGNYFRKEQREETDWISVRAMPSYYVIHSLRIITIIIVSAILSKWIDSRRSGRRIVHNVNDTKLPWKNYLLHFVA